jgi:hypothetical protein
VPEAVVEEPNLFEHGFNLILKYSGAFDPFKEETDPATPASEIPNGSRFERLFGSNSEQKLEMDSRKAVQEPIRNMVAPVAAGVSAQGNFFNQFNSGMNEDRFNLNQVNRQQQDALLFRDAQQQQQQSTAPRFGGQQQMNFYGSAPYQLGAATENQGDDLMYALLGNRTVNANAVKNTLGQQQQRPILGQQQGQFGISG